MSSSNAHFLSSSGPRPFALQHLQDNLAVLGFAMKDLPKGEERKSIFLIILVEVVII